MRPLFLRPLFTAALVAIALWLGAGGLLVANTWRTLERARTIEELFRQTHTVEGCLFDLQRLLLVDVEPGAAPAAGRVIELREAVARLRALAPFIHPQTDFELAEVQDLLARPDLEPRQALAASLITLRDLLELERQARFDLSRDLGAEARTDLLVTAGVLMGLVGLSVVTFVLMRRRVFHPLRELGHLLTRLAGGEFTPIPVTGVDPMLVPLFRHYNGMVERLSALEAEQRRHTESLEGEVRSATRALLAQQRSLIRAERLAAAGEAAASIAHELRNPMSGVQMVLANLQQELAGRRRAGPEAGGGTGAGAASGEPELDDEQVAARLGSASEELTRINRLLTRLLDEARHRPEPVVRLDVGTVLGDLAALLRHQLPDALSLTVVAEGDLVCRLPEGALRQAVMNLVLNAAQAVGEGPGRVEIEARRSGSELAIAVGDDGPGLPAELLASGVRPFWSQRPGGTGLGLAMVRRFARDLGGSLRLGNRHEGGARVELRLPVTEEPDGRDPAAD